MNQVENAAPRAASNSSEAEGKGKGEGKGEEKEKKDNWKQEMRLWGTCADAVQ